MHRRALLKLLTALIPGAGALAWPPPAGFAQGPATASAGKIFDCYLDQSGKPRSRVRHPFVIGALLTSQPEHHTQAILDLRKRYAYGRWLQWHTTDATRFPFVSHLIDHFFTSSDMALVALAYSADAIAQWPSDVADSEAMYYGSHLAVLSNLPLPHNATVRVHIRAHQTSTGKDRFLHDRINERFGNRGVTVQFDDNSLLMGMSDILSGAIFGAALRATGHNTAKTKVDIIDLIATRLGVDSLTAPSLSQHRKYRVIPGHT